MPRTAIDFAASLLNLPAVISAESRLCAPEVQRDTPATQKRARTILLVNALPAPAWPLTDGVVALRRFSFDAVPAVTSSSGPGDPPVDRWHP